MLSNNNIPNKYWCW